MLPVHNQLPPAIQARNHAMNWLLDTFPQAFDLRNRKPLSTTLLEDICALNHPDQPSRSALASAIHYYSHWGSYLSALKEGADRHDLKGNVCGTVNKVEAEQAQAILQHPTE